MNICIIGSGYVGLVTGACLSEFGHNVICVDQDTYKIDSLKNGIIPIYEDGLEERILKNMQQKRLHFTTDLGRAVEESEVIFIAVGTPPMDSGEADLQDVLSVAHSIGKYVDNYKVIIDKSTVPVGTGRKVYEAVEEEIKKRGYNIEFDVVSNPEFLREGVAIGDFEKPDRVVIGTDNEKALDIMKKIYAPLIHRGVPFVFTNLETAELIKYASNAFLAMKISYTNQIAELCEKVGANILKVADGMGYDKRIAHYTLHAGAGFGGSCFPKDTKALLKIGENVGVDISLIRQVIKVNEDQKEKMAQKIENALKDLKDKKIAILGLAFKPQTDDMREAPSIKIIDILTKKGAKIAAYDPAAVKNAQMYMSDKDIYYADDLYDAAKNADAVAIITEWNEFSSIDFNKLKEIMSDKYFFDFRNVYNRENVEEYGFIYEGVGT